MDPYEIIDNLTIDTPKIDFNILSLLKIPVFVILFINMLFAFMMYLRVRILSDTFSSPDNKIVKTVILIHLFVTLIGSLISLLFIILS
ncbi:MAG TPA: hypothetical protein PLD77_02120 [Candidatus Dojkabacteria bacterium]|nr:hypothetical protein [Candidatus Dojkabacteria bacterium]